MTHKLITQLERDIRNQVRINSMLRLNRRQKLMVQIGRFNHILLIGIIGSLLIWALLILGVVRAFAVDCPTPGEPCKVIFLSPQEEKLLTAQNGILDTAAQGRQIDLGGFAVYFKSKIATAPAGEMKPVPTPEPTPPNRVQDVPAK
jgi:hypothetical protein